MKPQHMVFIVKVIETMIYLVHELLAEAKVP